MTDKPSKNEDEYFGKQNLEIIHEMRLKLDAERRHAERKAHHNKCPRCGADLKERHAEHVQIDECPECGAGNKGLWGGGPPRAAPGQQGGVHGLHGRPGTSPRAKGNTGSGIMALGGRDRVTPHPRCAGAPLRRGRP